MVERSPEHDLAERVADAWRDDAPPELNAAQAAAFDDGVYRALASRRTRRRWGIAALIPLAAASAIAVWVVGVPVASNDVEILGTLADADSAWETTGEDLSTTRTLAWLAQPDPQGDLAAYLGSDETAFAAWLEQAAPTSNIDPPSGDRSTK